MLSINELPSGCVCSPSVGLQRLVPPNLITGIKQFNANHSGCSHWSFCDVQLVILENLGVARTAETLGIIRNFPTLL